MNSLLSSSLGYATTSVSVDGTRPDNHGHDESTCDSDAIEFVRSNEPTGKLTAMRAETAIEHDRLVLRR